MFKTLADSKSTTLSAQVGKNFGKFVCLQLRHDSPTTNAQQAQLTKDMVRIKYRPPRTIPDKSAEKLKTPADTDMIQEDFLATHIQLVNDTNPPSRLKYNFLPETGTLVHN